jgi:uncharacterized protein YtpQ (UPF0354 family)
VDVISTTFLPVLVSLQELRVEDEEETVLDEFVGDLAVGYAPGPAYQTPLTWADLEAMGTRKSVLRHRAFGCLSQAAGGARVMGRPPALMLSFGGRESCMVLADDFWEDLEADVPGELIIAVPARDVVIITGSASRPGLEKVRRAVDRLFFAGGDNLLSRDLLVWRRHGWEVWRPYPPNPRLSEW